jgi:hypothetical protein
MRTNVGPWFGLMTLMAALLLVGCPKGGGTGTSGSASGAYVKFLVAEAGSGESLAATVWPVGQPDDFDTVVQGNAGSETRFEGIGLREEGFALPFGPGQEVNLMVWSPGHELKRIDIKLKRGENLVVIDLKRTEIEDEALPDVIRTKVLEDLGGNIRTGT